MHEEYGPAGLAGVRQAGWQLLLRACCLCVAALLWLLADRSGLVMHQRYEIDGWGVVGGYLTW